MSLVSLLLIQSKNAIFVLVIWLVYKAFSSFFKHIRKMKGIPHVRGAILIITLTLVFLVASSTVIIFKYILNKWYMGMSINSSSVYDIVNALTSNRLEVYAKEISRWSQHLFFGNGLSYTLGFTRSHNWIIELLVQSGMIGFLVFISALLMWIKITIKYKSKDNFIKACYCFCIITLIQGLAEVSLFTATIDILFWTFAGLSVSHINYQLFG